MPAGLRQLDTNLWVHETSLRSFGIDWGRRMSVVRLEGGGLFLHSVAELTPELRAELDELGRVRYVVPANALHGHFFMEQYRTAYPDMKLFSAPPLDGRRRDLWFDALLGEEPDPGWADDVDQKAFLGHRFYPEIAFFHRPTRSLIVGDLVFNVVGAHGPGDIKGRLFGVPRKLGPTRPYRLMLRNKEAARRSLERILEWDIERVVVGHGEIVETGGREALRGAYAWLLHSRA